METNRKTIVALRGGSKQGKTSTLKLLVEKFVQNPGFSILSHKFTPNGEDEFIIAANQKRKIAVITAGDTEEVDFMDQMLQECVHTNVDIIFAASRTSGRTHELLCDFARINGYRVVQSSPFYTFLSDKQFQDNLNNAAASGLFGLLSIL